MQQHQLNTQNPEAITYSTEEILYTILGGIRLEGLDRLRVTIKVEVINRKFQHYLNNPDIAALAIRQNLDLYSITQVEKLARLIAERLEVGVTQVVSFPESWPLEVRDYLSMSYPIFRDTCKLEISGF
ncbi:MAG TPA: hypothetical protein VEB63_07500 [Chitinophagaceae bacterium]|nr:hypothetical protein [Chitinophagaceae bacterium]